MSTTPFSYPELPHISYPFVRDQVTGTVRAIEQDTVEHVMSCEQVIVRHPLGYRIDRPEFGWAWPELDGMPLDLGSLEQALRQFEPRGTATASQYADVAASVVHISVDVAIQSVETEKS
jgi:phage baseplate assembly protein W